MKKKDLFFNIGIVRLVLVIGAVIIFKFVLADKTAQGFKMNSFESISITDLNGDTVKLSDVLDEKDAVYLMIFNLNNCYSCIYDGLKDLKNLKDSGKSAIAVIVDNRLDEVQGWSSTQDFSPFYIMKTVDFYENVQSMLLPVIVKIEDKKIVRFRFITP